MSQNYLWIDEKIGKTKAYKIVPETIYVSISKYSLGNAPNIFSQTSFEISQRIYRSILRCVPMFFFSFSFRIYDTQSKIGQKGRLEISAPHKSPLFSSRSLIIGRDFERTTRKLVIFENVDVLNRFPKSESDNYPYDVRV